MGRCWESLQEEHERHTSETPTTRYFGDQGDFFFLIKVNIQRFTSKDLLSVPLMPGLLSSPSSRKTSAQRPFVFPEELMWAEVFGNIFTRQLRCPWFPCTASSRSSWGPILGSQSTQHQVDFFFRHLFSELMWSQAWNLRRWSPWRQMQFKKWLISINNCQEVSNEWVLTCSAKNSLTVICCMLLKNTSLQKKTALGCNMTVFSVAYFSSCKWFLPSKFSSRLCTTEWARRQRWLKNWHWAMDIKT